MSMLGGLGLFIGCRVSINVQTGRLFSALQAGDRRVFGRALGALALWHVGMFATQMTSAVITAVLGLRWRRWLSNRFVISWLHAGAHVGALDNPDQRIAEDCKRVVDSTLDMISQLFSAVVTFISFAVLLWQLSTSLPISLFGVTYRVPGQLLWITIFYAALKTVFASWLGKPNIFWDRRKQQTEADYRVGLVRLRSDIRSLNDHQDIEQTARQADARFLSVYSTALGSLYYSTRYFSFTSIVGIVSQYGPYLLLAPAFFSGALPLGVLTQIVGAFGQASGSLAWFVDSYLWIADWTASVTRLKELQVEISERSPQA